MNKRMSLSARVTLVALGLTCLWLTPQVAHAGACAG